MNNPLAFPNVTDLEMAPGNYKPVSEGMTLLDYFAGQVISSFNWPSMAHYNEHARAMAESAYNIAEAMLIEREKRIK